MTHFKCCHHAPRLPCIALVPLSAFGFAADLFSNCTVVSLLLFVTISLLIFVTHRVPAAVQVVRLLNVRKWAEVIVPCIDPDLARFAMAEKTGESIHCFRFLRGETASHPALMFYRYSHMDGPHFAWRPKPVQEGQLLDNRYCVSKVQCTGFKCWEVTATKEGMEKKLPPMTSCGIHVLRGGYPDLLQLEEHDVTEGWLESGGAYGKLRSLIKKVGSRAVLPLL